MIHEGEGASHVIHGIIDECGKECESLGYCERRVGREGYKFRVEGEGAVLSVAIYNVLIEIF